MAIRAVVFDVDGVLVRAGVFAEILERDHGLDRAATADFFHGPFKDCVLGRSDLKESITPFLHRWALPGTVDDCLRLWFEADSEMNGPVLEIVRELRGRGVPCYAGSTQESYRAAYLEDTMGIGREFDRLFFSCHVGASKPHAAFFEHVSAEIGVDPRELLLIDDAEPNVDGAREAGWHAELYAWGDDIRALLGRHQMLDPDA